MKKPKKDPFQRFKELTTSQFQFLESEFGFTQEAAETFGVACQIPYTNKSTSIKVEYEYSGSLWVQLARLEETPESGIVQTDRFGLELILLEAGVMDIAEVSEPHPVPEEELEPALAEAASNLRKYAQPFLRGDFSDYPRIMAFNEKLSQQME
jgi:hypothetical protein